MNRIAALSLAIFLLAGTGTALGQVLDPAPLEIDKKEEVEVNLVLVETLVMDKKGRTVPDLTKDDFLLSVGGRAVEIDELDVVCPEGASDDPQPIGQKERREPLMPGVPRRVVLLFDYYHLGHPQRMDTLNYAQAMVQSGMAENEEILVASLANGVRIEQRFTSDRTQVIRALQRMEVDVTLFARDFQPLTDRSFFNNLEVLMDVLAGYDGAKAVVMFSSFMAPSDDTDLWFQGVAQHAAAARTVLYPVWAAGMSVGGPTGGSPSLARLANESGGRFTRGTNDLSVAYARAQRDLTCRYTLGFYVDANDKDKRQAVRVRVERGGLEVRAPELIRLFSEEQRQQSRLRAAFVDPEPVDDPLLRANVFPLRPYSGKGWYALTSLHFPLVVDSGTERREIGLALLRNHVEVGTFQEPIAVTRPKSAKSSTVPVTMFGISKLKPGTYTLTVVLEEPGNERLQSTRTEFQVPDVPEGLLFIRGPRLVRVEQGGVLIPAGKEIRKRKSEVAALTEALGPDGTMAPLLVHEIDSDDEVLALWEACLAGGDPPPAGAVVRRRILREDGEVVEGLDPVPLKLEGDKKVGCHGDLEKIPSGSLAPGEYTLEIVVEDGSGGLVTKGSTPLRVR